MIRVITSKMHLFSYFLKAVKIMNVKLGDEKQ